MKDKKYLSLYNSLKNDIENGIYGPEDKLPSKRMMCVRSGFSMITVERAYAMLLDEGYVFSLEKKGYYVSDAAYLRSENCKAVRSPRLPEPENFSDEQFEYSVWFKTVRRVIAENGSRLFLKSPNKGCEVLRNAVSDYLFRCRGIEADPENIIIGSGAEQLYEMSVKLIGLDKVYGIEDPSYEQIWYLYSSLGLRVSKLRMCRDGIDLDELSGKSFDVLHVTPFHSYPTGWSTSVSKKIGYIKWVSAGNRYIIEDDFDSEFYLPVMPIRTLYSMDPTHSTIYINTFSKSLSPAMRIGYMIIPDKLSGKYDETLGHLSCGVPVMDQYVLAEFIRSGSFERHLNKMRKRLNKKTT